MLLFLRVSIWHKKDSECIGHCTKWTKYNFIYICSSESDSQQTILKLCMLEIRCFVQDPEKHSVATLMPSGLNNYYIGACGCGRVNTKIQMALFSATVLKDAFVFYFFYFLIFYWNIWKVRIILAQKRQQNIWQHWWILCCSIKSSSCYLHFWLWEAIILITQI